MVRKENLDLSDENMMEDNEMGNLDEEESELESKSGEDEDFKLAEPSKTSIYNWLKVSKSTKKTYFDDFQV